MLRQTHPDSAASSFNGLHPRPIRPKKAAKQQLLIGWLCVCQQCLVSQAVLSYILLQEMCLWLCEPQCLCRGGSADSPTGEYHERGQQEGRSESPS